MAKFFITGARGFIGTHLARELAHAGHVVAGLGHGLWPEPNARASGVWPWINGDISAANLRLLQKESFTPDAIFHLAGGSSVGVSLANPLEDFHRTVVSSIELLEWVRQDAPQTRVIAVSSAAVYGNGHAGRISESTTPRPCSPYGHHKHAMEQLCVSYAESYGIQVQVARLFSVYGPGLTKQLLWDLCTRLAGGATTLRLGGTGNELRDWTDVRDVARALLHVLESGASLGRFINVATGTGTPVRDIAGKVAAHWRSGDRRIPIEFNGIVRPGDPFSLVASPEQLLNSGFEWSTEVHAGIKEYVTWYCDQVRQPTWA